MNYNLVLSISLATLAGLSTGIGGLISVFFKRTNKNVLSLLLGFSAGIMIYISFIELYQESQTNLCGIHGPVNGKILTVLSFFFGTTLMALLNELIPEPNHPHRARKLKSINDSGVSAGYRSREKLMRTGMFTAIAVTLHNFPEGLASYVSTMKSSALGVSIALAIAIHNIPEGIAISIPVFYATGSRKKAFFASLLSGLSESFGAVIAMAVLGRIISDTMFGIIFGAVAGIMVYISLDELLPTSREYGQSNLSLLGLLLGMAVMALSVIFIF
ncbi:MAG: zinc transporter ZupT [Clostridiaceae bacterium]|nr:zinc transporter ZupT [Clostridiaceae bacterium]